MAYFKFQSFGEFLEFGLLLKKNNTKTQIFFSRSLRLVFSNTSEEEKIICEAKYDMSSMHLCMSEEISNKKNCTCDKIRLDDVS